jgi:uncharacterized DUF497 family protein
MAEAFGIRRLDWDAWNLEHIRKHDVSQVEVEQVIAIRPVFRDTYKGRLTAIGPAESGRMLVVVVGPSPIVAGLWYVFSARPASRKERSIYQRMRGAPL